jgi:hypothetical protein
MTDFDTDDGVIFILALLVAVRNNVIVIARKNNEKIRSCRIPQVDIAYTPRRLITMTKLWRAHV